MSEVVLVKTRMREGVWEGVLKHHPGEPDLSITHLEAPVEGVSVVTAGTDDEWVIKVPIPVSAIGDGVQTFLIVDAKSGAKLKSFAIAAGAPLSEDLRAEVDLLRAELDMLKRAFRRHCVETEVI